MDMLRERWKIFTFRAYVLYFWGTTVSMFGTGMQFIANSWLVLQITGSNISVAWVLICSSIPGIFLSPSIGVLVDRLDRKWLAASMDLARACVLIAIPIFWWLGSLQAWHLYLISFLIAVGDQVYNPTVMALIRELIPKEMLLSANTTSGIANQMGALLGSGLAGILITLFSPVIIMWINAASFVVSAVCILQMRKGILLPTPSENRTGNGWGAFLGNLFEGGTYIQQHRDIIPKYLMMLFLVATLRTINVLLAPFAKGVLTVGSKGFGYIDAAFAAGALCGGFFLPMLVRKFGRNVIMTAGMLGLSGSLFFFACSMQLWMAMTGYFLIGLTFQVRLLYLTSAQESIEVEYQGRVHSTFNTFFSLASLGIYLLMSVLGELYSIRLLYVLQGGLILIAGFMAFWMFMHKEEKRYVES